MANVLFCIHFTVYPLIHNDSSLNHTFCMDFIFHKFLTSPTLSLKRSGSIFHYFIVGVILKFEFVFLRWQFVRKFYLLSKAKRSFCHLIKLWKWQALHMNPVYSHAHLSIPHDYHTQFIHTGTHLQPSTITIIEVLSSRFYVPMHLVMLEIVAF